MAKFCRKCGKKLDEDTRLCPNCDTDKPKDKEYQEELPQNNNESGQTQINIKEKRKQKKIVKRKNKKVKKESWSLRKKTISFIFKFLLIVLGTAVLVVSVIYVLAYFKVMDIPYVSYILERSGLEKRIDIEIDPQSNNYVPDESTIAFDESTNMFYANNEIIVIFRKNATDIEKEKVILYLQGNVVGTIPNMNMYQIRIAGDKTLYELESIADDVTFRFDSVIFATYDTAIVNSSEAYAPNDPWNKDVSKDDWYNNNIDKSNWWIKAIEAQMAWDYNDEFSKVIVGICDSSFDTGHEDLKSRVSFPNEILKSRNIVTPWWYNLENLKHLKSWNVSKQKNYHGTHVAGIIGAEGDNKKGITGIVQNCDILLAPYYRSENMKSYLAWDSSTYANLSYLVEAGAKIINFSQGKTNLLQENSTNNREYGEKVIEREGNLASISIAQLIASGYRDFLVVQSAGNGTGDTGKALDAIQNGWFASITNKSITGDGDITIADVRNHVIIVGAAEQSLSGYQCTSFSNFGVQVNVCAPGVKIYSTIPGEIFYDFQFSGGYGFECGTSMSAPIVTGVCALTWAANPDLSAKQVKDIVCNEHSVVVAKNPESNDNTEYNMVNAKLSVEAAFNYDKDHGKNVSIDVPDNAVEYNGHYYYLYTGGTASSYDEAAQYCINKGGYLATLTSQEENDFVYSYITQQGCESAYFGLSDSESEGRWEWCTGEPLYYINWHNGEPNGENSNEDYALFYYKYSDGTWNDGDFSGNTINAGNAFICEWGDYSPEQTKVPDGEKTSGERNIVLTLDVSGSMFGTPMEETKKASKKFINAVLEQDASIGIVTYDDISNIASGFSADRLSLQNIVSGLYDGGGTNIEAGLKDAQWMLEKTNSQKKIIVLMSDGEPNDGLLDEDLIAYANEIKKTGTIIYTIGFFENLSERSYAQYLMESIASDGYHYEVANADELAFFFEDMADQINGQKYIYVRIACPVDVSVTFDGETLDSSEENFNARTSFGTLTFEENREKMDSGMDARVKVLRLKEGAEYDLKLTGTGHGIMNYTIGFMDDNGDYSDLRKFENVKITRRTRIDTIAANSDDSILNIDEDGDGKYDIRLRAEANSYGEEMATSNWIIYVIIGAVVFIMFGIVAIVIYIKNKKKKGE